MFVHTLGFEKQGCIGIIEDCFVWQQHLMDEAPEIEVLLADGDHRYLARTSFGLVGSQLRIS